MPDWSEDLINRSKSYWDEAIDGYIHPVSLEWVTYVPIDRQNVLALYESSTLHRMIAVLLYRDYITDSSWYAANDYNEYRRAVRLVPNAVSNYRHISHQIAVAFGVTGCSICGRSCPETVAIMRNGSAVCPAHYHEMSWCDNCCTWAREDDWDEDYGCCTACACSAATCVGCGERVLRSYCYDDESYCQDCYDDRFGRCENCDRTCPIDDLENGLCESCAEEGRYRVRDYSTNVIRVLGRNCYGNPPLDKLMLGVELEAQFLQFPHDSYGWTSSQRTAFNECVGACYEAAGMDFVILKHDASIYDHGVEIVSLPASLQTHKEKWEHFFTNLPRGLRSWKSGQCGIHIHMSREGLTKLTIGKMVAFLNDGANEPLIRKIAGRYDTGYAHKREKTVKDYRGNDHHEMLALSNTKTVEMRIFRGTLNKLHFYADLEFAHSLAKFCFDISMMYLKERTYLRWLAEHRKDYPNLYNFLASYTPTSEEIEEAACA